MKWGTHSVENRAATRLTHLLLFCVASLLNVAMPLRIAAQTPQPAGTKPVATLGSFQSVSGNTLTVTNDAGSQLQFTVAPDTKLLRIPPGVKDLSQATPLQLSDLQQGDRVLIRQRCSADQPPACSVFAVVAIKKEDIAAKQERERQEWQRNGIGGLVKSVDSAAGSVTMSTSSVAGLKDVVIHIASTTIVRRYAPGSIKFDDAKPSSLTEIHPGDQLRARGTRSADGAEFTAVEIVTGSFQNIAGTISSVDSASGTLTIADLISSKSVRVKVTNDSQLRKLPDAMAQRIAARLKAAAAGAPGAGNPAAAAQPAPANQGPSMGGGAAPPGARAGDLQALLSRLPASKLSDFDKGQAVLLVATSAKPGDAVTAITMLGGVEPILQASPKGQTASILTPWSLSGAGEEGGGGQ